MSMWVVGCHFAYRVFSVYGRLSHKRCFSCLGIYQCDDTDFLNSNLIIILVALVTLYL